MRFRFQRNGFILATLITALALLPGELWAQLVPRNILLVVADDIGTDSLAMFNTNSVDTSFAPTPNLDALAAQGVRFRNCYGYPSCSPTRSCLLTGRYGFRTGIGAAIDDVYDPYLSPRDFTIPKALDANPQLGFRHAQIGKWHLSENPIDPNLIGGWNHYSGFLAGERSSYYEWEKTVNGVNSTNTTYTTSDNATDAINWITAQGTNRWFLWFAPKAAHSPLHKPPNELHSYDFLPDEPPANGAFSKLYYQAMIEALDTEMGRLMTNIDLAETMVVFIGDNGTPIETVQSPYTTEQCKGTLTEGGIRLPMFIVGAGVVETNRWSEALVHAVDVTTTMLDLAGVNPATLPTNMVFDGRSFAHVLRNEPGLPSPAPPIILAENFGSIIPPPLRGVAARNPRYKLIQLDAGPQFFYDLQTDPYEHTNLFGNLTPQQLAVYASLTNRLAFWHNPPITPTASGVHVESGAVTMSVSEQLGIAYSLLRTTNLTTPQWLPVPNFVREIHPTQPIVLLSDPSPPATAFYRVSAQGR